MDKTDPKANLVLLEFQFLNQAVQRNKTSVRKLSSHFEYLWNQMHVWIWQPIRKPYHKHSVVIIIIICLFQHWGLGGWSCLVWVLVFDLTIKSGPIRSLKLLTASLSESLAHANPSTTARSNSFNSKKTFKWLRFQQEFNEWSPDKILVLKFETIIQKLVWVNECMFVVTVMLY